MINTTTTVNYIEYYLIPDQSCGVFLNTPNSLGFVMPYRLHAGCFIGGQPMTSDVRATDINYNGSPLLTGWGLY